MAQQQRRVLRSATKPGPRPSRYARWGVSYRESSSEAETESSKAEEQDDSEKQAEVAATEERLIRRRNPDKMLRQHSPPSPASSDSSAILYKTRKRKRSADSHPSRARLSMSYLNNQASNGDAFSSDTIPPWASLPYQILVQIFHYASYPLCDERTFQPSASVGWLIKTSRLCRGFSEPALTILYRSPPLIPMDRAHKLRQLLMADPGPMSYNYRAKVERVCMEVSQTAAYTLPGSGLLDLHGLIYNCPRLLDLELYHQKDFSPYRSLGDSIKWTYPDSLFFALNCNVSGVPTYLRSWRWSSRLAGKKRPIESLLDIHRTASFNGLRKIAFVNYQKVIARKNAEDPHHEKLLANSLSVLLDLEHLIFESSSLANSILLPLLPASLKHLELINCCNVTSDDLAHFLTSRGSQLRSLNLNHNQSLNLSFLTVLGSACQKLETLKMNLTCYNALSTYRDSEPQYDKLLDTDEKPCWSASLRTIELTQLRKWDIDTARMFFQSLLESADSLVNLRRLVIKAIINTNWRDRSSFRDEWVGAFERVFKRPFIPPKPQLQSLDAYTEHKKRNDEVCHGSLDEGSDGGVLCRPLKGDCLTESQEDSKIQFRSNEIHTKPFSSRVKRQTINHNKVEDCYGGSQQCQTSNTRRSTRHALATLPPLPDADKYRTAQSLRPRKELLNHITSPGVPGSKTYHPSRNETERKRVINRELQIPQSTASTNQPSHLTPITASSDDNSCGCNSDSDNKPLASRRQACSAKQPQHIQGMCDVVSITIDNLRPTETQFVEADFLDSEPEGDEDWDGTEDLVGDGQYAW